MPSIGTLGSTLPLGPKNFKVKCQAFPHNGSTRPWLEQPLQLARLAQRTITGLEPRLQLPVAGRSENFLVDTGATYSVLTSYSGAFSPQTCTIWGATGKTITKRLTQVLICCWDVQTVSHQFLVVPEYPTPLLGSYLSLPSKSCSYCNPIRICFKTLFCGKTNYFYQPPSETTPEWERSFMDV